MKRRPPLESGDNGFESHGGYMTAKITKLEEQFNQSAQYTVKSKLFEGISIFVNGYTSPSAEELKRIMMQNSGIFHHYKRSHTKFVIASNLPDVKLRSNITRNIVKPEWIVDCLKENRLLDYSKYLLYTNKKRTQPEINFKTTNVEQVKKDVHSFAFSLEALNAKLHEEIKSEQVNDKEMKTGTAVDSNFLQDFLNNSRLHHIATLGAGFKYHINDLRKKHNGKFPHREELKKKLKKSEMTYDCQEIVMHIDMDCFFVSVSLKNYPHLKGLPVAVTHSKGKNDSSTEDFNSYSEIASCSYEARAKGLKNGMFVGAGMKLCPELKTIPYNFEDYKQTASIFYNTIAKYTLDIEAVSCDELYVDLKSLIVECGIDVMDFVTILRQEIFDQTSCTCSVGIGRNRLQARMATKEAKPNGQFELLSINVEEYMRTKTIRELPGVGYHTNHQLEQLKLETCEQLQNFPLSMLQQSFGKKIGETLHKISKGIDEKKLIFEQVRKSVSVEVNYGIRFNENEEVYTFLQQVAEELSKRLKNINKKGKHLTLKIMARAKDASVETTKFMGHGIVEKASKSISLLASTDDSQMIHNSVLKLIDSLNIPPHELRGIGVQMSKLNEDKKDSKLLEMFKKAAEKEHISVHQQPKLEHTKVDPSPKKEAKSSPKKRGRRPKFAVNDKSNMSVSDLFTTKKNAKISFKRTAERIDPKVLSELPSELVDEILREYQVEYQVSDEEEERTDFDENILQEVSNDNVFLKENWRFIVKTWIDSNDEIVTIDSNEKFGIDVSELISLRNIDLVYLVMKYFHRIIKTTGNTRWQAIYINVLSRVQTEMMKSYGKKLAVFTEF